VPALVEDEGVLRHAASAAVVGVEGLAEFYSGKQEPEVLMKPLAQLLQAPSGESWRQPMSLGGFEV
jgi:hypothetical protein